MRLCVDELLCSGVETRIQCEVARVNGLAPLCSKVDCDFKMTFVVSATRLHHGILIKCTKPRLHQKVFLSLEYFRIGLLCYKIDFIILSLTYVVLYVATLCLCELLTEGGSDCSSALIVV